MQRCSSYSSRSWRGRSSSAGWCRRTWSSCSGLLVVIGALIVLSIKAAFLWSLAYGVTLVLAVVLPEQIEPLHVVEGSPAGIA